MVHTEYDGGVPESNPEKDRYLSTSYSSKVTCGACGAPLRHVPVMYEHMDIDWRCGRCLRRDKPVLEDHVG